MTAQRQMELLVIRYVPHVIKSEQLNIGVIVFEKTDGLITFVDARFISNMKAVLDFDPDADIDVLQSCFRDFEKRIHDPDDREEFITTIQETFSNVLQVSDPKNILVSAKPERDIDDLASLYFPPAD